VRILYLADTRFPLERANGIQTFETCRALAARGHAVTLIVRPDTTEPPRDPWDFYGAARDSRLTINVAPTIAGPVRRPAYLLGVLPRIASRADDVVLTRDLGMASIAVRLGRGMRPPVIYEAHGYAPAVSEELPRLLGSAEPPSPRKLARLAARERRVWLQAEGYVTLTAAHRDELAARFGPRRNAAVVPDGTRLSAHRSYSPRSPRETLVVGYAGHLYPWKGVDTLIDALVTAPSMRAVIIGGQPGERDGARLQALARERGVATRTEFTGWQRPADVAALLVQCDILVLPNVRSTISERYTSPLKLFEYLAAGRPIVASNLPALREVLTDGINAVLVEPGNAAALANALNGLANNPQLADRLARRAFADASLYSWDARAARLEPVLVEAGGRS
jgi:glycosyltransferase involved in cell wall biosynthesis